MPKRVRTRARPAHADVWLRAPVWTSRKQRLAIGTMIVAAALGSLASAGAAPHRAAATVPLPPANTHSDGPLASAPPFGKPIAARPSSSPVAKPPTTRGAPGTTTDPRPAAALAPQLAADGIPGVALDAYRKAAARVARTDPACGLTWPLLAGIGRVESDHGRFAGSQLYADGTSAPRVIGIPLDGVGTALIRDTDRGVLDGDTVYDRAVGPMQFIPSTWARWGVDGNGDHVISPFNVYDAALAAADYLCAAGGDVRTPDGQSRAVLAYNDSAAYLATVLTLEQAYASGAPGVTIPILPSAPKPGPPEKPVLPPVDPGPPLGLQHRKPKPKPPAGSSSRPHPAPSTPAGSTPASTSATASAGSTGPIITTTPATASGAPACPAAAPTPWSVLSDAAALLGILTGTATPTESSSPAPADAACSTTATPASASPSDAPSTGPSTG
jgi:membrane-bound lytic murein transglycosylase B